MKDPSKLNLRQVMDFLKGTGTSTLKLVGRDGAGKTTFLVVIATNEAAQDLEPLISEFEGSQG